MFLKDIFIRNFRNYEEEKITFNPGVNIIYGDNAQGKTNLLESIYVLGLTKSHRSFIDDNLIKENCSYANICGTIDIDSYPTKLEVNIGKSIKKLKIDNNDIKKVSDYISKLNIIIFYPDDLELIKGAPAVRRKYINVQLSQIYNNYFNLLSEYNNILKIRNELLKKYSKKEVVDDNYFEIINKYFVQKSADIYLIRKKYINQLNEIAPAIFYNISSKNDFNISYKPNIEINVFEKENLEELITKKIEKLKEVERKLGSSLVGPHRDDVEFYIGDQNIRSFGSQGQQRMAILALKLSEIDVFKKHYNQTPILLLDDVFSELDDGKKNNLLNFITEQVQTIITTTDLKKLDKKILENAKLINIDSGKVVTERVEIDGK